MGSRPSFCGDKMAIYEVQCRYCSTLQIIDSKKHLFKRYEDNGDAGMYALCQNDNCNRLFRIITEDLREIKEPEKYLNRGR